MPLFGPPRVIQTAATVSTAQVKTVPSCFKGEERVCKLLCAAQCLNKHFIWQCCDKQKASLRICKLHMVEYFSDLRLIFFFLSYYICSQYGKFPTILLSWATRLFPFWGDEEKQSTGYQVALPAVTIIFGFILKQLNIKIKHLSLDMSTPRVWISFSFYLNLSKYFSHWSFNTVCIAS